jgi:AAA+ superfamily predicted ATPase
LGKHHKHIYRNVTANAVKEFWVSGMFMDIRPATPDEIAGKSSEQASCYLQLYHEERKIWLQWGFCWDLDTDAVEPLDEVWGDDAQRRFARGNEETRKRIEQLGHRREPRYYGTPEEVLEVCREVWAKWGFDSFGQPLNGVWDDDAQMRKARAAEEVEKRLQQSPSCARRPRKRTGRGLSQVAGMDELKEQLVHEVLGPFKNPELFRRYRVTLPNGILFYGPPGCGKTYIGRNLAEELGWHFQYCRPSDVASPYIHDTVSRIRAVFNKAIEQAPSILFIDEFEAFVPARSELGGHQQYKAEEVNEFLSNLEGCAERNVLVIAATNEPERIDPAVRRSGRFDKLIYIPPPDFDARRAILEFHLRDRPLDEPLDVSQIASVLEGYSASDIKLLVDEAARVALKQFQPISTNTLLTARERVPPSITRDDTERYSNVRSRGRS